jgi:hypothetical protein
MAEPKPKFDLLANVDAAGRRRIGVEVLRTMPQANVSEARGILEAAFADVVGRPPSRREAFGVECWLTHFPAAVDRAEEVALVIRRHGSKPRRWSDLVGWIEGPLYLSYPLEPFEVGAMRSAPQTPSAPDAQDLPEIAVAIVARSRTAQLTGARA